jgi:hypothetical protein
VEVLSVGPAGGAGHATSSTSTSVFSRNSTDPAPSAQQSGVNSQLVTLAVTQAAALRLVQITVTGLPYLALLGH